MFDPHRLIPGNELSTNCLCFTRNLKNGPQTAQSTVQCWSSFFKIGWQQLCVVCRKQEPLPHQYEITFFPTCETMYMEQIRKNVLRLTQDQVGGRRILCSIMQSASISTNLQAALLTISVENLQENFKLFSLTIPFSHSSMSFWKNPKL